MTMWMALGAIALVPCLTTFDRRYLLTLDNAGFASSRALALTSFTVPGLFLRFSQ